MINALASNLALVQKEYPCFSKAIASEFESIVRKNGIQVAIDRNEKISSQLSVKNFNFTCSLDEVAELAVTLSRTCLALISDLRCEEAMYKECSDIAEQYRIVPPYPREYGGAIEPCLKRLACSKWWKRKLLRLKRTSVEHVARELSLVHFNAQRYCSSVSVSTTQELKDKCSHFLSDSFAENEIGELVSLEDLSSKSVSNPAIRRTELIVRTKGFEQVAQTLGDIGLFVTLSAPSRFHRMKKVYNANGHVVKVVKNTAYDGSSVADCQAYFQNIWSCIGAKYKRNDIKPYGFRVVEPHHDGTPHWHFLLFVPQVQKTKLVEIFEEYGLKDSPNEKGAVDHRVKIIDMKNEIDKATGKQRSATGYIIKYICKNIDGHGVNNDKAEGQDWANSNAVESARHIEAYARTNRIRQFQQIGGPSVTCWRQLRRLTEQEGALEELRNACDKGDWAKFVMLTGGTTIDRAERSVSPAYAKSEKLELKTGEIVPVLKTQYGDDAAERVVGVEFAGALILARTHWWNVQENEKVKEARQQIMDGITSLLEEVRRQNSDSKNQQGAKRAA